MAFSAVFTSGVNLKSGSTMFLHWIKTNASTGTNEHHRLGTYFSLFASVSCCSRRKPAVCLSIRVYSAFRAIHSSKTKNTKPIKPRGGSIGNNMSCPKDKYNTQGICGKKVKRTKADTWGTFSFKFPSKPNQIRDISVTTQIIQANGIKKVCLKAKFWTLVDWRKYERDKC